MSARTGETSVPLNPEDRARMARLYEEIEGRLHEMALIAARTLALDTSAIESRSLGRVLGRAAQQGPASTSDRPLEFQGLEIVCTPDGVCGCYDHDAGTCSPC
jgi:hypothetical protein